MTKKDTSNQQEKPSSISKSPVKSLSAEKIKKEILTPSNTIKQEKQATTPVTKMDAKKQFKKNKLKKIKMIRDSFTMPENDYIKLEEMKKRCLKVGVHVKKSELLRAGLLYLSQQNDELLLNTIAKIEVIKTGRPAKINI